MIATNYRLSSRYHFINSRFEGSTYNSSLLPIIPDIWERLIQQISEKVLNVSNVAYELCRIGHIRFSSSYFLHESKGKKTIKYIVVLWNGALIIIFELYLFLVMHTLTTVQIRHPHFLLSPTHPWFISSLNTTIFSVTIWQKPEHIM